MNFCIKFIIAAMLYMLLGITWPNSNAVCDDGGLVTDQNDTSKTGLLKKNSQEDEESEDEEKETPKSVDHDSKDEIEEHTNQRRKIVSMKGVRGKDFKELCKAVARDGREELIYTIFSAEYYDEELCVACKPFIKITSQACKPNRIEARKKTTKKEGEEAVEPTATPKPNYKERDPSADVLAKISYIFGNLADMPAAMDLLPVIDYLTLMLTDTEERTRGEIEYLSVISTYINAPFQKVHKQAEKLREEADRGFN